MRIEIGHEIKMEKERLGAYKFTIELPASREGKEVTGLEISGLSVPASVKQYETRTFRGTIKYADGSTEKADIHVGYDFTSGIGDEEG